MGKGGSGRQAPEDFNNPFSRLGQELKGKKSSKSKPQANERQASAAATQNNKPQTDQPDFVSDFSAEDADASAMFLAAIGRVRENPKPRNASPSEQSMAELLAEAGNKRRDQADNREARVTTGLNAPGVKQPERNLAQISVSQMHPEHEQIELSPDEADSFTKAMQGVKPVDSSRGRALVPPAPPAPVRHKSVERDYLAEFAEGKYEFALEYTEEFFEGHVMGLDPLVVAKLRAGQYSPEGHIDLHGMNSEQALQALLEFVRTAYNQGRRNLIVVTGRGKNSPGGQSVLRQHLRDWLTKDPLKRVILAFCTAQPKDGGAGAFYVILRKYKKNQGKIRWDPNPWEESPLI